MVNLPLARRPVVWLATAAIPLLLAGCDSSTSGTGPNPNDTEPASVTLSSNRLLMAPDSAHVLAATIRNEAGSILGLGATWTAEDESVATVSGDGTVRALANGTTRITAQAGPASASAVLRVLESPEFGATLGGVLGEDFYLVNYVDQGPSGVVTDWACGGRSYDGHRGVDLLLRSFEQMDEGVPVLAPAPGRVIGVKDGAYDRNKSWDNGGGFANYVVIEHPNGLWTTYGHLRKNSITVAVGDLVERGDSIALVGSAGTSDHPHLHFQVQDTTRVLDPYSGSCSTALSLWADQEPYQDRFAFIDGGVTTAPMTVDLAKDPPPRADSVSSSQQRLSVWIHLANVTAGTLTTYRFIAPDGSEAVSRTWNQPSSYSMSWWWITQDIPGVLTDLGEWTVEVTNSASPEVLTRTFFLVQGTSPTSEPTPGTPGYRFGGGGLRGGR